MIDRPDPTNPQATGRAYRTAELRLQHAELEARLLELRAEGLAFLPALAVAATLFLACGAVALAACTVALLSGGGA